MSPETQQQTGKTANTNQACTRPLKTTLARPQELTWEAWLRGVWSERERAGLLLNYNEERGGTRSRGRGRASRKEKRRGGRNHTSRARKRAEPEQRRIRGREGDEGSEGG